MPLILLWPKQALSVGDVEPISIFMLCDAMLVPLFVRLSLPETENANLDQMIQTLLLHNQESRCSTGICTTINALPNFHSLPLNTDRVKVR